MKYYIIAGEASGDLHASNLVKELMEAAPATTVRGWGGDKMEAAGVTLVKHYRDLAFMGFTEVIKNLPTILRNLSFCKKDILEFQPDALVLVDYPGFNLRIAKWAHQQGFKVIYYISPQVWAWKENRVHDIKKYVDKMLVILPFEEAFYEKWDYPVSYVGHPLVEVVDGFMQNPEPLQLEEGLSTDKLIALLPGSRKQEIKAKLPIMLKVTKHFPGFQFVVAKAPGLPAAFYDDLLKGYPNVTAVVDQTYALLNSASAALVTSGTATLETALFQVPEIICYKGNRISYEIAKRLIRIKYIGLVNLIMDKLVVKELIQHELNEENLVKELKSLLYDGEKKLQLSRDYEALRKVLRAGGHASSNAARIILEYVGPINEVT